jgi:selenocysteine lyase/cysteine desulfurase
MNDTRRVGRPASPAREPHFLRAEFPILERKAYLNSNSLGALSRRAMQERRRFEELWNELGASAWYQIWMAKLDEVRAALGRTIGASGDEIALMPSVSATLAAVAGAVAGATDVRQRPKVVLTELDFPTVGHHFLSRQALGIEVEIVRSPDGIEIPLDALADAIDERTALVVTSHVFFSTGAVQDAAAIGSIAHEAGARVLLDAYQSNGQLPIDVRALGVDFLVSGLLKWLCGGPGLAYLYVRPDVDMAPTTLSWFGVEDQFAFDLRDATPRRDARRFEMGTPPMGAVYTAAGGLAVIEEAGIERIRERNRALAGDLRDRLAGAGLALHESPSPERRSALVLARHPDPQGAVAYLAENDVIIDSRGPFVRLSPHFYNSIEDNERAVEVLKRYQR